MFPALAIVIASLGKLVSGGEVNCCPVDWIYNKDFNACYLDRCTGEGVGVATSFAGARTACQSMEAELTSITSGQENSFIFDALVSDLLDGSFCWIGVQETSPDKFTWLDGTPFGYNNIINDDTTGCWAMEGPGLDTPGSWWELSCNNPLGYVCKTASACSTI